MEILRRYQFNLEMYKFINYGGSSKCRNWIYWRVTFGFIFRKFLLVSSFECFSPIGPWNISRIRGGLLSGCVTSQTDARHWYWLAKFLLNNRLWFKSGARSLRKVLSSHWENGNHVSSKPTSSGWYSQTQHTKRLNRTSIKKDLFSNSKQLCCPCKNPFTA